MVEDGRKRQTIRLPRKRKTVKGDILYLYTGMRTKACRKLGEAKCKSVMGIMLFSNGDVYWRDHRWLKKSEIQRIAKDDGFDNAEKFYTFFETHYGLPAKLELIKW